MIKSFKQILLNEKILLKINKGIKVYFNDTKDHLFTDKLNRANITDTIVLKNLNRITKRIKSEKLKSNNYTFVFDEFKISGTYNEERQELFITTILTKNMIPYKKDTIVNIDESLNYIIIDMREN